MKLFGDYHTHTIYSRNNHGKGTIEENVIVAKQKGLKEIAISDHGFNHMFFGVKKEKLLEMRKECDRLSEKYNIKVLLGLETNLISQNGETDLLEGYEKYLDIVLMGFHNGIKPKSLKDFNFFLKNKMFYTQNQINKNTDAYLKCIDKNNINIITHLNYGMPVITKKVVEHANKKNIFIELNGKRIFFSNEDVLEMLSLNTKFIVNSDAHKPSRVGETNLPYSFILKNNIPLENIVNIDKIPNFKG